VPFAGSGSECLAARMEEREFISFELNSDYIEIAEKRLRDWENSRVRELVLT